MFFPTGLPNAQYNLTYPDPTKRKTTLHLILIYKKNIRIELLMLKKVLCVKPPKTFSWPMKSFTINREPN